MTEKQPTRKEIMARIDELRRQHNANAKAIAEAQGGAAEVAGPNTATTLNGNEETARPEKDPSRWKKFLEKRRQKNIEQATSLSESEAQARENSLRWFEKGSMSRKIAMTIGFAGLTTLAIMVFNHVPYEQIGAQLAKMAPKTFFYAGLNAALTSANGLKFTEKLDNKLGGRGLFTARNIMTGISGLTIGITALITQAWVVALIGAGGIAAGRGLNYAISKMAGSSKSKWWTVAQTLSSLGLGLVISDLSNEAHAKHELKLAIEARQDYEPSSEWNLLHPKIPQMTDEIKLSDDVVKTLEKLEATNRAESTEQSTEPVVPPATTSHETPPSSNTAQQTTEHESTASKQTSATEHTPKHTEGAVTEEKTAETHTSVESADLQQARAEVEAKEVALKEAEYQSRLAQIRAESAKTEIRIVENNSDESLLTEAKERAGYAETRIAQTQETELIARQELEEAKANYEYQRGLATDQNTTNYENDPDTIVGEDTQAEITRDEIEEELEQEAEDNRIQSVRDAETEAELDKKLEPEKDATSDQQPQSRNDLGKSDADYEPSIPTEPAQPQTIDAKSKIIDYGHPDRVEGEAEKDMYQPDHPEETKIDPEVNRIIENTRDDHNNQPFDNSKMNLTNPEEDPEKFTRELRENLYPEKKLERHLGEKADHFPSEKTEHSHAQSENALNDAQLYEMNRVSLHNTQFLENLSKGGEKDLLPLLKGEAEDMLHKNTWNLTNQEIKLLEYLNKIYNIVKDNPTMKELADPLNGNKLLGIKPETVWEYIHRLLPEIAKINKLNEVELKD